MKTQTQQTQQATCATHSTSRASNAQHKNTKQTTHGPVERRRRGGARTARVNVIWNRFRRPFVVYARAFSRRARGAFAVLFALLCFRRVISRPLRCVPSHFRGAYFVLSLCCRCADAVLRCTFSGAFTSLPRAARTAGRQRSTYIFQGCI